MFDGFSITSLIAGIILVVVIPSTFHNVIGVYFSDDFLRVYIIGTYNDTWFRLSGKKILKKKIEKSVGTRYIIYI